MTALPDPLFSQKARVVGLDSLRFIAALWVTFGHLGGPPIFAGLDRSHWLGFVIHGVYGNLFPGPPAVMVFFVISGFCIHYPYRQPGSFLLLPYLTRRYLRIGIPLVIAISASRPLHVNLQLFQNSILWSLFAELVYYSLYPLLRLLKQRIGWSRMIALSFILAFITLLAHPEAKDYSPFGIRLSWLLGLPCWLLGCRLADTIQAQDASPSSAGRIWSWRFGIWLFAVIASVLRFHSPIGYPWTLLALALPITMWISEEVHYFREHPTNGLLEWAGRWSYSVYLIHLLANAAYSAAGFVGLAPMTNWILKIAWVFISSWCFFLLIENPAHFIARKVGGKLGRRPPNKPMGVQLPTHP